MNKHYRKLETSAALVPLREVGTEVALPADLVGAAKGFRVNARAKRTKEAYGLWWRDFTGWCASNGRESLPAGIPTVIGYMTHLATGRSGARKALAPASIGIALAAIKLAHRTAGEPYDSGDARLTETMKGIKRESAKTRAIRRVKPLMFHSKTGISLSDLLEILRPDVLREARDAALIALGCSAALRRSELVGLDWAVLGTSKDDARTGFLSIDDGGMTVRLMTSKASQDTAQDVAVPRDFSQLTCKVVENWIKVGNIQRGSPLFRSVNGAFLTDTPISKYVGVTWNRKSEQWRAQYKRALGHFDSEDKAHAAYCKAKGVPTGRPEERVKPSLERLHDRSVPRIMKARVRQLAELKNKRGKKLSKEEVAELVELIGGHSMRVGFVTSAAERDVPSHRIRQQTRHKTEAMVSTYIRDVDARKNNALKDFGL